MNSLDLIREEIAIMKKLNHPNVVSLIEVLDDPDEDSLYMVMEMCKKGVVMHVGLDQTAEPYEEEQCRLWLRDMILGLEYLHAQGIIHRDIKPDNCLITDDDTLKFVDFGVSEMFEKDSDMNTAKSAGSPAFMPPELCVAKHGEVSGRACDIWSMGVTLYCLRYGRIPFEKTGMLDLYESIKHDNIDLGSKCDEDFEDLITQLLEKDPDKRIKIEKLREHPWVTKHGADPLLPKEDNITTLIEPPTEEELNHAITGNMGRLMVVMKAAKRFKQLLVQKRPELMESIFGGSSRFVQPPLSINPLWRTHSSDLDNRKPVEHALAAERIHGDIEISDNLKKPPKNLNVVANHGSDMASTNTEGTRAAHEADLLRNSSPLPANEQEAKAGYKQGQAHDPLEDTLYLGVGTGEEEPAEWSTFVAVSESPGATDFNVYERAYEEEVERLLSKQKDSSHCPMLFLTRRVEQIKEIRENEHHIDYFKQKAPGAANTAFKKLVEQAKSNVDDATSMAHSAKDDPAYLKNLLGPDKEKVLANVEAASNKLSSSTSPPSALQQDETAKSKFGFTKLIDKAKQHIEAAKPQKPAASVAK